MPATWAKQNAWTILDTTCGATVLGGAFLECWQAWRSDPLRPRMLHYVAIAQSNSVLTEAFLPPSGDNANIPQGMIDEVREACVDLAPGFNRLVFEQGQVSLTLCIGEVKDMLAEQAFTADTMFLGAQPWDPWQLKLLAKCCRRGTRFQVEQLSPEAATLFLACGFQFDASPPAATNTQATTQAITQAQTGTLRSGTFNPSWRIATSRQRRSTQPPTIARCAIVGAGLSGATVAHALALRGWQVTVFDAHATPAGGASGLPAGLVVPHISADEDPRSRISRSGTRLMLQWARRLLVQGQDWAPTGVQEHKRSSANSNKANIHWHAHAGWIKPAALVRALLAHPGIRFCGQAQVQQMGFENEAWVLRNAAGGELGRAEQLIFANALGCVPLLGTLPAQNQAPVKINLDDLHGVHGTLTRGAYTAHTSAKVLSSFPPFPVNGNGSFLPGIPADQGFEWLLGATFENNPTLEPSDISNQHQANLAKLQQLLPTTAAALAPVFASGAVSAWSGTRCVSHDRLPLVGPLLEGAAPSLWINAAMGSRGLSFAGLCAQLLVAQLCAEPLPIEASLARSLDVRRVRRQRGRKA